MEVRAARVRTLSYNKYYYQFSPVHCFSFVAAAVPKNWPYKRIFDIRLQRLLESGTVDSIRRHWENDLPDCKKVEEDEDYLALGPGVYCEFCLINQLHNSSCFVSSRKTHKFVRHNRSWIHCIVYHFHNRGYQKIHGQCSSIAIINKSSTVCFA